MGDWLATTDYQSIVELCESYNMGRLYEIFWQYSSLKTTVLVEQSALCWFYREKNDLKGFAITRKVNGLTTIEELWGKLDGWYGPEGSLHQKDLERVKDFKELVNSLEKPLRLRSAVDNHFANGMAFSLGLAWVNAMVLGTQRLENTVKVETPKLLTIREYIEGDEEYIQKMYSHYYNNPNDIAFFREWIHKPACKTFIAEKGDKFCGYIITEKRRDRIGDFDIAIRPDSLRTGVGSALLKTGMNSLFERGVELLIADYMTMNQATNMFYLHHNFKTERVYNYFKIS